MLDVVVSKDALARFREPASVDDRRMVELVAENRDIGIAEDLEDPEVRRVSGRKYECGFRALPVRNRAFELEMECARARHEARGTRACTPALQRLAGCAAHARMRGEPEIVVRREAHDFAFAHLTSRAVAVERDRAPPTIGVPDSVQLAAQPIVPNAHTNTSSRAARSVVTMRSISSAVIVNGGTRMMLLPSERANTPRLTIAAQVRRAKRNSVDAFSSSIAAMRPYCRISRTPPFVRTRSSSAVRNCVARARTLSSTFQRWNSSRWRSATAAASALPP